MRAGSVWLKPELAHISGGYRVCGSLLKVLSTSLYRSFVTVAVVPDSSVKGGPTMLLPDSSVKGGPTMLLPDSSMKGGPTMLLPDSSVKGGPTMLLPDSSMKGGPTMLLPDSSMKGGPTMLLPDSSMKGGPTMLLAAIAVHTVHLAGRSGLVATLLGLEVSKKTFVFEFTFPSR